MSEKISQNNAEIISHPSPEQRDILIAKTVELIEKNPRLTFFIRASGVVVPGEDLSDKGTYTYLFNQKTKRMSRGRDARTSYIEQNIIRNDLHIEQNESFHVYYNLYETDSASIINVKIPFNPSSGTTNDFVTYRLGRAIDFGLAFDHRLPGDIEHALKEKALKEFFENPTSSTEAKTFFRLLFIQCARKYIPGYFNFFMELVSAHHGLREGSPGCIVQRVIEDDVVSWKLKKLIH